MEEKPSPVLTGQTGVAGSAQRDRLVKEQIEKQRAEFDAKTARLRKLRLARDAELAAQPKPAPNPKARPKRKR